MGLVLADVGFRVRFVCDCVEKARLAEVIVGIVHFLAADHLLSVINMTLIPTGDILKNWLYLPILLLIKPHLVRIHITVLVIVLVIEAHLPENVFLFVALRGELVIGVVLLEEAVAVLVALQHRQDARLQVVRHNVGRLPMRHQNPLLQINRTFRCRCRYSCNM